MNKNTFTPTKLTANQQPLKTMAQLSSVYFKVACELRNKTLSSDKDMFPHLYVFPSVIMFVSALEAFFNEALELANCTTNNMELKETIVEIKAGVGEYKRLSHRVKAIFMLCDRKSKGINTNGLEYQNLVALVELRNSVVHYNPTFIDHVKWPNRLKKVLQRSKIEIMNSGWVVNFMSPTISQWSYQTTKSIIELFSEVSGAKHLFDFSENYHDI